MTVTNGAKPAGGGTPPGTDRRSRVGISIANVTKEFRLQGSTVVALENVSQDIEPGKFVAVVGRSGCGKTTLLRIIAGLESPTQGEVHFTSSLGATAIEPSIGFVFQEPNLMPWRSVLRNVTLPLEVQGTRRREARRRAAEALKVVGLSAFEGALPHQLSGGMRQRVALARALVYDPQVLLLDEPFGALDAQTRDDLNLNLQDIWLQLGKTAVLVTHSISEAVFLADRVMVLSARPGRVKEVVDVELPRPRTITMLDEPEFGALSKRIRALLSEPERPGDR